MGEDITQIEFSSTDDQSFQDKLDQELHFTRKLFVEKKFDNQSRKLGYELECCLIDQHGYPAAFNQQVLDDANNPSLTYELARFNLELNGNVFDVNDRVFSDIEKDMSLLYQQVDESARRYHKQAGLFGVLPSLDMQHLDMDDYMSNMTRYRLLNQQLMSMRGSPVQLDIQSMDHLRVSKDDVMLESLGTSLQIHYQTPLDEAVDTYHAALWASVPLLAACANSPLVLQKYCWQESRIEIFKQAVDCRTEAQKQDGMLSRVFLAKGYINSWFELFEENAYFNPILPEVLETPIDELHHLNLHNGTIWRWIRPIIGKNENSKHHLRLELRTVPAGPTLIDSMANLVFFVGLIEGLKQDKDALTRIPYETLEKSFYQVARLGLLAEVNWCHGVFESVQQIILKYTIPLARQGLENLGIDAHEYLDIIQQRVITGQTGARWMVQYWTKNKNTAALVDTYLKFARLNIPVHRWSKP